MGQCQTPRVTHRSTNATLCIVISDVRQDCTLCGIQIPWIGKTIHEKSTKEPSTLLTEALVGTKNKTCRDNTQENPTEVSRVWGRGAGTQLLNELCRAHAPTEAKRQVLSSEFYTDLVTDSSRSTGQSQNGHPAIFCQSSTSSCYLSTY